MSTMLLPDLTHRAPASRWLPDALPERIDGEWTKNRFDELLVCADQAGDEPRAWLELIERASELQAYLESRETAVAIDFAQRTDAPEASDEYERWSREVEPVSLDGAVAVAGRICSAPQACAKAIADRHGQHFLDLTESFHRSYAPINTALRTQLSNTLMRRTHIMGSAIIEWRGESHPFSFAGKAALDPDRAHRHAAWHSKVEFVRTHEDELQRVFDEALELRQSMADNLGARSFTDLRYAEMDRFDWTPADAARFRGAVERHMVPLVERMHLAQARALGTDLLHPADELIQPKPVPQPIVGVGDQLAAATQTFDAMGDAFGVPWRMLVEEGLIDLPARVGKDTGGFCATLPHEGVPFIFCNSVGSHDDVRTIVHEFGHALQAWLSRDIEPIDLRRPTMEACEIHSMTLELLAAPHLATFFGAEQLDAFNLDTLRDSLVYMPYMAAVDELQHRIYDEGLDAAGRARAWHAAAARFQPGMDATADAWFAGQRWMLQSHIFEAPFYYLDYALARMVSWELWLDSLEDHDAAIERYLALCSAGGTKPFRQLVRDAGLSDPFDEAAIERTMARLAPHLQLDQL